MICMFPILVEHHQQVSNEKESHLSIQTQTIQPPINNHSQLAVAPRTNSHTQIQPKIPSQQAQSAFVIPWQALLPMLTATSGPTSPPPSELSPPLSAPPLNAISNVPGPILDTPEEEADVEQMPATTEDDDDVFEAETADTSITDSNNKRRSQSLSSLQSNNKEIGLTKVKYFLFVMLRFSCTISDKGTYKKTYECFYDIFETTSYIGS